MLFSESAELKVEEYHKSIGGTPQPGSTKKGKKDAQKRTASEALDSPAPSATKKRGGRKSQTNGTDSEQTPFVLPKGSWESDVSHVMSIVEEPEPDEAKPGKTNKILMGFIEWKDGRKSKHPMKTLRTKCPQSLLTYYENHL
jgi:chromobox protein 1